MTAPAPAARTADVAEHPVPGHPAAVHSRRRPRLALPRALHPVAWWVWALGMAAAASRTTNPLLLLVLVAVVGYVVAARRGDAPWARAYKAYLLLGLSVVVLRVLFRVLLGADDGGRVLLVLPSLHLPEWADGVALGGPVTAEELLAAVYDGLRLAALLCCIGAANTLADPKRALRALPAALYEIGTVIVVALTVAPQLVESVLRVRRARRLRGASGRGLHALRAIAVPVLEDALARSLRLAAAMDSRGYARTRSIGASDRRATSALVLAGLLGLCLGLYGLLDATAPRLLGTGGLLAGFLLCVAGLLVGGRRIGTTRYRPDPWRAPEWAVAGSGLAVAALVIAAGIADPLLLHPPLSPPTWPDLPLLPFAAVLLGLLPAWAAPPPPRAEVTS